MDLPLLAEEQVLRPGAEVLRWGALRNGLERTTRQLENTRRVRGAERNAGWV